MPGGTNGFPGGAQTPIPGGGQNSLRRYYAAPKIVYVSGNSGVITGGGSFTLPATSGTTANVIVIGGGYGAGGGGGGVNPNNNDGWMTPAPGSVGAVYIYW